MRFAIISCSLDPDSRSRILAEWARRLLADAGHDATLIDLRDVALPPFDNADTFDHPSYPLLHAHIAQSDGVVIAAPVYNWGLGSSVKAMIELTGAHDGAHRRAAWFDKLVTFLCAGGLPQSYMAHLPIATGLMLDFKSVLNPYHVYAASSEWQGAEPGDALQNRLARTIAVKLELATALRHRAYRSDWEI